MVVAYGALVVALVVARVVALVVVVLAALWCSCSWRCQWWTGGGREEERIKQPAVLVLLSVLTFEREGRIKQPAVRIFVELTFRDIYSRSARVSVAC